MCFTVLFLCIAATFSMHKAPDLCEKNGLSLNNNVFAYMY